MIPAVAVLVPFTRETSLAPEHERLMTAHHKPVPWERSTASELPERVRAMLADLWRARMISEHRSIGVFNVYALDLLGAGLPAEVLSLACRAALDEVRHAELFARLTSLYSGVPETAPAGIPPMPDDAGISMREQVAREAMFLCVCSETFSAASLGALHDRAKDPAVKGALGVVLADEIHHARMGWSLLAAMARDEDGPAIRARMQADLVTVFDTFVSEAFTQHPEPDWGGERERALAEDHGYITNDADFAIFRAMIEDVWMPGLTALGVDPSELSGRYATRPASR